MKVFLNSILIQGVKNSPTEILRNLQQNSAFWAHIEVINNFHLKLKFYMKKCLKLYIDYIAFQFFSNLLFYKFQFEMKHH